MVLPHLHVAHDVLAHHDRVVDQDADGEREAEQRHRVQREAEGEHGDERGQHRDRQGEAGDDRRAPGVEEEKDDQHGQRRTFDQRLLDVPHRRRDARAGVADDVEGHALRERRLHLFDLFANRRGDLRGAEALRLLDVETDRLIAVEHGGGARLLGAVARIGNVAEADHAALRLRDRQPGEVRRLLQPALETDRALLELTVEAAHRRREVLRLQGLHDLRDAQAGRLQVARPQLHRQLALDAADHFDLGHAGYAAQPPGDVGIGEPRQLGPLHLRGRQHQRHDRQVGRIEPRQDRLFHLRRQLVADLGDLVADLLRRLLQILLELEERDDHAVAVERVRLDLVDAADPRDAFLDAVDDLALDALRRRARVRHRHDDHRVLHVRELVGVQQREREDPEHGEREHHDRRDDGTLDGEVGDEHGALSSSGC